MNGKISNIAQVASIRRYTLSEGAARGLDVLDCDNGRIRFLLNISHGLDVMQLYHEGQNMSFVSKNGFVKEGLPFLNRFEGGMIYTCGLDSVGGRDGFELHGSYHMTPAQLLLARCDEDGIAVEAVIRSTALFGNNLVLHRRITAKAGSDSITVEDRLANEGYKPAPYCLLYHINMGYPMLDEGARVVADVEGMTPRNDRAEQFKAAAFDITAPCDDGEEECFFLELRRPEISLVNDRIGKKFTVNYSADTLPCFLEWRSMVSGDYALGFEPATTLLDGGFEYKLLMPGQSVDFKVQLSVEKI